MVTGGHRSSAITGGCGTSVALLFDLGGLPDAIAQVVELGPTDIATGDDLDLGEDRGVHGEGALDADAEADLAHGEGLAQAIALTADSSVVTSISNDSTFARVFARQVEGLGRPGDVLIGISTSGGSHNVVQAVQAARRMGMKVVILTGSSGVLAGMADCALRVPSANTQRIQETHILMEHLLCQLGETKTRKNQVLKAKGKKSK